MAVGPRVQQHRASSRCGFSFVGLHESFTCEHAHYEVCALLGYRGVHSLGESRVTAMHDPSATNNMNLVVTCFALLYVTEHYVVIGLVVTTVVAVAMVSGPSSLLTLESMPTITCHYPRRCSTLTSLSCVLMS